MASQNVARGVSMFVTGNNDDEQHTYGVDLSPEGLVKTFYWLFVHVHGMWHAKANPIEL